MAYADGVLDAQERARVDAILAADPAQRQRLEPFVLTRHALPSFFSEALTSAVPDRLVNTVLAAPIGTRASAEVRGTRREPFFTRLRTALFPELPAFAGAFALAACVAAIAGTGFIAGRVAEPGGGMQTAALDDEAIAAGALNTALDTAVSNEVVERGLVRVTPVMTFRDTAGRYCRQYTMLRAGKDEYAGFACRRGDGRWNVAFHAPVEPAAGGASNAGEPKKADPNSFQPAGDNRGHALQQAIDKAVSGNVLNSNDETRLIADGWPQEAGSDQDGRHKN